MNMIEHCKIENELDQNGNPTGGYAYGLGLMIDWQRGPLGRHTKDCKPGSHGVGCTRAEPNGAFVETVISAARQRLEFYQAASNGKFACEENATAIAKLGEALEVLNNRTRNREERQVEGMHQV